VYIPNKKKAKTKNWENKKKKKKTIVKYLHRNNQ